jgi:hypothetical protein
MTELDAYQKSQSLEGNLYLEGKLDALRILYQEYLEAQIRGVKVVPTNELLAVIRTLILNLEEIRSVDS